MADSLIQGLFKTGAPWGILCAVLVLACIALWKRIGTLSDRLFELATKQVEVNTETRTTLQSVEKDVEDISRRFKTQ